jgi:high affinity sulfate transporter 1
MSTQRLRPADRGRRLIVPWAQGFDRSWLRGDLVAGLALGFVLIPQGMAYADLAGMPLVAGLYATILAIIGYAILGSSRQLVIGPDSSTSTLVAASVVAIVGANAAPERYIAIATGLAVVSGIVLFLAALLKMGAISALISRPVLVGYLNGLAITIIVGQLPKILGYKAAGEGPIEKLGAIIGGLSQTLTTPLIVGIVSLVVLLGLPRIAPRIPAALVVIIAAIVLVPVLGLDQGQLALVGQIPSGLPSLSVPDLQTGDVSLLIGSAVAIAFMGFADTSVASEVFARRGGYRVDANKDLMGLGLASILSGLFGGFAVSGSDSRTAVSERSGGRSQVANLIAIGVVALVLMFASGVLKTLPYAVLAAVIVAAAIGLFDVPTLRAAWRQERSSFWLAITALVGTLVLGLLPGILLAVLLSLGVVLMRSAKTRIVVEGRGDSADDWRDVSKVPTAITVPGVLVIRYQSPLFFANADGFRSAVEDLIDGAETPVRTVVFDAAATSYADFSAVGVLADLVDDLDARDITLAIADATGATEQAIEKAGLVDRLASARMFPTVDAAFRVLVGTPQDGASGAGPSAGAPTASTTTAPTPAQGGTTA